MESVAASSDRGLNTRSDVNGRVNRTANSETFRDQGQLSAILTDAAYKHIKPPTKSTEEFIGNGGGESKYVEAHFRIFDQFSWNHVWSGMNVLLTLYVLNQYYHRPSPSRSEDYNLSPSQAAGKRASTCASGGVEEDYHIGLHVAALFIILVVSATACAFPLVIIRFPRLRIPSTFLFSARHFGTGVLIATAFVHLLPTAFLSLTNQCLPPFWTEKYPAMPGAIALAAVFVLMLVEMVFSPARHLCSAQYQQPSTRDGHMVSLKGQPDSQALQEAHSSNNTDVVHDGINRNLGPIHGRPNSVARSIPDMEEQNTAHEQIEAIVVEREANSDRKGKDTTSAPQPEELNMTEPTTEQDREKRILQCVLLEVGILFHSIFIGMALSVSAGSEFAVLLIAIAFHQTFEGLALGSRLAVIEWPPAALQPWIMAFAYGCTTPLGQARGLATRNLYSPESIVGLLMVGIMNAISSGLLIHASLVDLLSEDFLSEQSWQVLRGKRRVWACVLVFAGALGMSVIGGWA